MTIKLDDFGEVVWKTPPKPKRKRKVKTFSEAFKLLGEALF